MSFIPDLQLSKLFYLEAVKPILDDHFLNLRHSASLLGSGSEVLGFDTEMSADHNWGARLFLFLSAADHEVQAENIHSKLGYHLPFTFRDHPTHFVPAPTDREAVAQRHPKSLIPDREAVAQRHPQSQLPNRPLNHLVKIVTLPTFLVDHLGLALEGELSLLQWLTIPEQKLRTLTTGAVYHDGLGILEPLRRNLSYYPHDVWLYLLSAQWQRIGQEEPFVGRTRIAGDEIGSAVIAARLVRDLMRLCLLMEKQ